MSTTAVFDYVSEYVYSQQPGPSGVTTDWDTCILCQKVTSEVLQCPARKRSIVTVGQGYSTLSSNIVRFSELHELPMPIDIGRLDRRWHRSYSAKSTRLRGTNPQHHEVATSEKEVPWMIVKSDGQAINQTLQEDNGLV